MRRSLLLITAVLMLPLLPASAQDKDSTEKDYTRGWYIGAQAGMPMAEADFSSFGADKFRSGWSAGIHAGYSFTPVWSLEVSAVWGQQFLAEQDCCFERGYWISPATWERFRDKDFLKTAEGFYYKDLKSRTFVQRYGLQVNMNVLGFFNATKDSRWRLDISPAMYAVGTSSDLMTKADNTLVADNLRDWHLGYGGQAQVSYAVAKNMSVGVYGGFTHLSGKPMDGMPELHSTNFIIDAGVKFSFAFGRKKRSGKTAVTDSSLRSSTFVQNDNADGTPAPVTPSDPSVIPSDIPVIPSDIPVIPSDTPVIPSTSTVIPSEVEESPAESSSEISPLPPVGRNDNVEESPDVFATPNDTPVILSASPVIPSTSTVIPSEVEESPFPVIYFSFNSIWIEPGERAKVKAIADMMKADKSIRILVTGWSDEVGGEDINKRVSLLRAEAVKRVLGQWLIPAERVETVGAGINRTAANDTEARIATTIEILQSPASPVIPNDTPVIPSEGTARDEESKTR